jgi:hypothetical protein
VQSLAGDVSPGVFTKIQNRLDLILHLQHDMHGVGERPIPHLRGELFVIGELLAQHRCVDEKRDDGVDRDIGGGDLTGQDFGEGGNGCLGDRIGAAAAGQPVTGSRADDDDAAPTRQA